MSNTQNLSSVVDVTLEISPLTPVIPTYNQGLIIGNSGRIPTTGSNARLREYTGLSSILTDGYQLTDPEYIAAELYFGQSPAPTVLYLGAQDPTAAQTIAITTGGHAGTGYAVGDTGTITHTSASGATYRVLTVTSGAVATVQLIAGGTGYPVGTANSTVATTGTGTGLELDITAIGETPLQALTACRLANSDWYGFTVCGAATADIEAMAAFAEASVPRCLQFGTTSDAAVLNNTTGNLAATLKTSDYDRTYTRYTTLANGTTCDLGRAMGLNTGLPGSYFTMKFKDLTGETPANVTISQAAAIENNNCNLYVNMANKYQWVEQGTVASGKFLDEIINLDMFAADVQLSGTNVLVTNNYVPLTEAGQTMIKSSVIGACDRAVQRGFLSAGTWQGDDILSLKNGDAMPAGYVVMSVPVAQLSPTQRSNRQGPAIIVCIAETGATHSTSIGILVQR